MNTNTYKYNQIHTSLFWTVLSLFHLIQHVTMIPQLMRQCLQFLHHLGIAFVDLALRIWEWSATLPPTQQVVLMVPFDLMQQRCKGARRTIKEMQLLCKEVSYTSSWQNGERTGKRKCKLLPADGAWWSMLLLVTDVYLNVSQDWEWVLNVINHLVPSWSGCKDHSTEISRNPFGKLRRLVAEATLAGTRDRTWIASSAHCWISTKRFCSVLSACGEKRFMQKTPIK